MHQDTNISILNLYKCLVKVAPWDDINFRFYFCNEVVYPPDHDFIFFGVFRLKKKIYQHFYETQTNFLYT